MQASCPSIRCFLEKLDYKRATGGLGYQLRGDKRSLSQSRIAAVLQILTSETKTQVSEFLGAAGYCCLCIPEFVEIERALFTSTKWGDTEPLIWTETKQKAFEALKIAPTPTPALEFLDIRGFYANFRAKKMSYDNWTL